MDTSSQQSQAMPPDVRVELGERSYSVRFYRGETARVATDIKPFCPERALVVSNETVWNLHGEALQAQLANAGIQAEVLLIGDGERFKTLETTSQVYDRLISGRYSRATCIIAFGGGVVGDLAGYAAATFLRGVDFVQIPTTVVAMVDSSVGGKTGVDHPLGKNLIGAFHQPRLVAVDVAYLDTLDDFNLHGGFAEIIKYGVIWDGKFFDWLEQNLERTLALKPDAIAHAVRTSCEIKAKVVGSDERESGLRAILNYGHTFGHAIESLGEYQERQFHGQAVAIGMCCAADLAVDMRLLAPEDATRIEALIRRAGLPVAVPVELAPDDIWDRMHVDKKASGGRVRFILPRSLGQVELRADVEKEQVIEVLRRRQSGV